MMDVLPRWGTRSQCIRTANHHDARFKYLTVIFVSYAFIKLKRIE